MSLHPFAEGNIAAAQKEARQCVEALRAAIVAKGDAEVWKRIAEALGHAAHVEAQLRDAVTLEEMAVTTGEENAA